MRPRFNHDEIAEIAYQAWVERGQPMGTPEVDWNYALAVVSDPEELRVGSDNHASSSLHEMDADVENPTDEAMETSSPTTIESASLVREPSKKKKHRS